MFCIVNTDKMKQMNSALPRCKQELVLFTAKEWNDATNMILFFFLRRILLRFRKTKMHAPSHPDLYST